MDRPHRYDAFLSYRHQEPDSSFARDLLARLEKAGYAVAIDEVDFVPNLPFLQEMERCIRESRFTLAVVSPRYLDSGNCEEEAVICKVLDMGERKRRLLPLGIEKVEMPVWMYSITGIDFTAANPLLDPYEKLERTLGLPLRLSDPDGFQVHPRVGEIFAGREKELDDIETSLLGQGRPAKLADSSTTLSKSGRTKKYPSTKKSATFSLSSSAGSILLSIISNEIRMATAKPPSNSSI